jgi:histidinol dehydrogenase
MIFRKLEDLSDEDLSSLLQREVGLEDILPKVGEILMDVASNGDKAVLSYTEKFEKAHLESLMVTQDEISAAYDAVDDDLLQSLAQAAENIEAFHAEQKERDLWMTEIEPGVMVGQKLVPLDSVGAYIPGGRASYPSSALMTIIPAKVAGVPRIVACTPPKSDGSIEPLTLVAADLAGADEIYKLGGAQAIAAMAFGTETITRVNKIVGPGNVYVTAAKMLVRGAVEIDFPAGPSEVLIIADGSADPEVIALDMMAQAEHDPSSIAILVTPDAALAKEVSDRVQAMAGSAERAEIITKSLEHGAILQSHDLEDAVEFSNAFAPEHLEIITIEPFEVLRNIRHAGSVFLGEFTPVAAGDYASGTNHVLPTSGYARAFSGLNVDAFLKKVTVQMITEDGLRLLEDTITSLANAEGLKAHAESVKRRLRR